MPCYRCEWGEDNVWSSGTSSSTALTWDLEGWCDSGSGWSSKPPVLPFLECNTSVSVYDPKRQAATERAEALLASHLTDAQRTELAAHGHFTVQGSAGGEYRISGLGVRRVDQGKAVERLCCHPDHAYPVGDRMLAQKLWLEADEPAFCQIANRTPLIKEVREFVERLCEDAA